MINEINEQFTFGCDAIAPEDGDLLFISIKPWMFFGLVLLVFAILPVKTLAQTSVGSDSTENVFIQIKEYELNSFFYSRLLPDEITAFGDLSVQEALFRIPGVQVSRDGEINLRGTGHNNYSVMLNGQRLSNTGLGTRNIVLESISIDAIREIQVSKVLDPSMDADALGGMINLNTTHTLGKSDTRKLSALLGGEANTEYISRTGPKSRGWINYAERYSDEFSAAVNLSFHESQNTWEELGLEFGTEDFGNGPVNVFERVSPSLKVDERGRYAANVDVRYDLSETSSYFFTGVFNSSEQTFTSHRDSWITNSDWVDETTTGTGEGVGSFSHEASLNDVNISQFTLQAGGDNQLETVTLSYNAGWSRSLTEAQHYLFPFQIEGLNYSLDISKRNRPQMEITNRQTQVLDDGTVDRQFMIGQNFDRVLQEHVNNQISARIDLDYPVSKGSIKAGTSARLSSKNGEYDENSFEYNRTLRMISFNMLKEPNRNIDVINNNYRVPWFVNTSNARAFLESQRPVFTGDENLRAYESEVRNYHTGEQIYAAYGMGDFSFGQLKVKGGLRLEYALSEFEGNEVIFNEEGELESLEKNEETESDIQLFPNAQFRYNITDNSNVTLAYSRTIDRPDYFFQTPFRRVDNQDSTIFSGNHLLDPISSNNLDLMFQYQIGYTGMVSVAGFYKELSNFIVRQEFNITGNNLFNGYQNVGYANSDESATIYGMEFSIRQSLYFLPGFFNNLGIYANYTWSDSKQETEQGELALTGQSPHVVNTALYYNQERFSAQLSYHWSADLLTQIARNREQAPSIATSPVYLDTYEDGYQNLSATAGYQLSDRFHIWANVYHLLKSEQTEYAESKKWYPESTNIRSGLEARIGVRFDL